MTGFKVTSANICDFIVYKKPYEYYIECKSVHGASLPFRNITETQWNGLLEKSKIRGVYAGIICWFIDKDITKFYLIGELDQLKDLEFKSVNYNWLSGWRIKGKKKRVFFDYDMKQFFEEMENENKHI